MILFIDVETTYITKNGKTYPTPYYPENKLVSVGWAREGAVDYAFTDQEAFREALQDNLDETTVLVAHNAKFDLGWLRECGFHYDGKVWDTQIVEYVLARGRKLPLSLKECCERYNTPHKKLNILEEYFERTVPTDEIPRADLETYGRMDVECLRDLYNAQMAELAKSENKCLIPTIEMMCEFLEVLLDMERNGIAIDVAALDEIQAEFLGEKRKLDERLLSIVNQVMGDRPYNLGSPEQLSQVIYSRRVVDKPIWADMFNLGSEQRGSVTKAKYRTRMSNAQFLDKVRSNTEVVRRTKVERCETCNGAGRVSVILSGGRISKRTKGCQTCDGRGVDYLPTGKTAGFKCVPEGPGDTAIGGFTTSKDKLEVLAREAVDPLAKEFLGGIVRSNAIETYLTSFVEGIRKGLFSNGLIRPKLNQAVTATGRLSSSEPNFQNLPRALTFPVRRAIKSRREGGTILEGDFGKLEYVTAVYLAQCPVGIQDIISNVDAHVITRDFLQEHGQIFLTETPKDRRQEAKPNTFQPLYGGKGNTQAEKKYCKFFLAKHKGIGKWHEELQSEAIRTKKIRIPTGREYAFPEAERTRWGTSTFATQIKNYPVQGFATADIVPLACILVYRELKRRKLQSCLILTVHDSLVVDVFPGELDQVVEIVRDGMLGVVLELKRRYNIDFNVPIDVELKSGSNWLAMKDVGVGRYDPTKQPMAAHGHLNLTHG